MRLSKIVCWFVSCISKWSSIGPVELEEDMPLVVGSGLGDCFLLLIVSIFVGVKWKYASSIDNG